MLDAGCPVRGIDANLLRHHRDQLPDSLLFDTPTTGASCRQQLCGMMDCESRS